MVACVYIRPYASFGTIIRLYTIKRLIITLQMFGVLILPSEFSAVDFESSDFLLIS